MSKRTDEAVRNFAEDLRGRTIDFARPTIHWAETVGNIAADNLNSWREDKRISKVDIYLEIREMVKNEFCHGSEYAVDMVMDRAAEMLVWLDCNGYLGKADHKKLTTGGLA